MDGRTDRASGSPCASGGNAAGEQGCGNGRAGGREVGGGRGCGAQRGARGLLGRMQAKGIVGNYTGLEWGV